MPGIIIWFFCPLCTHIFACFVLVSLYSRALIETRLIPRVLGRDHRILSSRIFLPYWIWQYIPVLDRWYDPLCRYHCSRRAWNYQCWGWFAYSRAFHSTSVITGLSLTHLNFYVRQDSDNLNNHWLYRTTLPRDRGTHNNCLMKGLMDFFWLPTSLRGGRLMLIIYCWF